MTTSSPAATVVVPAIEDELVHGHAAGDGPPPPAQPHLGDTSGRPRNAIGVADGDQRQGGFPVGAVRQPVGDALAGWYPLDQRDPGAQCHGGLQDRAGAARLVPDRIDSVEPDPAAHHVEDGLRPLQDRRCVGQMPPPRPEPRPHRRCREPAGTAAPAPAPMDRRPRPRRPDGSSIPPPAPPRPARWRRWPGPALRSRVRRRRRDPTRCRSSDGFRPVEALGRDAQPPVDHEMRPPIARRGPGRRKCPGPEPKARPPGERPGRQPRLRRPHPAWPARAPSLRPALRPAPPVSPRARTRPP